MKSKTLFTLLILIIVVMIFSSCAKSEKPAYISKEYEIYCTWVNSEYDNTQGPHPKVVINPNSKIDFYSASTASKPTPLQGKYFITNK